MYYDSKPPVDESFSTYCFSYTEFLTIYFTLAVNKNSPLPDGDYKMIMFINDFSYSDIREKIRPINSDDFARIIKRTITQYKLVAIIFDNLYPVRILFSMQLS